MKILLKETINGLGKYGEEVTVKNGYARNFLIPQKLAIPVTKFNQSIIKKLLQLAEQKNKAEKLALESLAEKIENLVISFSLKINEKGKIFGSVTLPAIIEKLNEENIKVDKNSLLLKAPLKTAGSHKIKLANTDAYLTVEVIAETDETLKTNINLTK